MSRFIFRDPYTRMELHRETIRVTPGKTCDWCGGVRKTKGGKPFLFHYYTEHDGAHFPRHQRVTRLLFCSIGCYRDYGA